LQPGLVEAIQRTVADHTAGSPVDQNIRWTNRSPRQIAQEIADDGFHVCPDTVRRILTEELELRLRQAVKEEAQTQFLFRDEQFRHLAELRVWYERHRWPVLSIDTKQKELLGNFFRRGRAYTDGQVRVQDHDFATPGLGRVIPYGVFDVVNNEGFLLLAQGSDTSELACDALWRWWQRLGRKRYWHASGLLVMCDCGGSNGYRRHRFKEELSWLASDLRRDIRVAHYPPGCSKYNPIEHRLFCHVTRALQGVALKTIHVAQRFISLTTTSTGLKVIAEIATKVYEKGGKVTRDFTDNISDLIDFNAFLPQLNYTALA
jgi:Rhodopirellula transposase DDE domain